MSKKEINYWKWFLKHWVKDNPTSSRFDCLVMELEAFMKGRTHVNKKNQWLNKSIKIWE